MLFLGSDAVLPAVGAPRPRRSGARPPREHGRDAARRVRPAALPALFTGVFFVFLFAPIVLVVIFSFNSSKSLQDFDGFSFRWYERSSSRRRSGRR